MNAFLTLLKGQEILDNFALLYLAEHIFLFVFVCLHKIVETGIFFLFEREGLSIIPHFFFTCK